MVAIEIDDDVILSLFTAAILFAVFAVIWFSRPKPPT